MERNPDADPNKVAAKLKHGYTVKEFTAKLLRAGYTSEQLAALRLGRQGARNTEEKTAINGGEKAYILSKKIVNSLWIHSSHHVLIFNFILYQELFRRVGRVYLGTRKKITKP